MPEVTPNQAILRRLEAMPNFHPANAKLFDGWLLDPGDVVTVTADGTAYAVPVYQMKVDWKGESQVEITSTGSEKRPPLSELKRRNYGAGRTAAQVEKQEEQIADVIYKTDFTKTDEGIGMLASAVGVKIETDPTKPGYGKPVYNTQTGKWEFDQNGATLTGQLKVQANEIALEVTQARGDSDTLSGRLGVMAGQISMVVTGTGENAEVNTAQIVLAINGGGQHSSALIEADVIDIEGVVNALQAWDITVVDITAQDITVNGTITGALTGNVEGNLNGSVLGEGHEGWFEDGLYVGVSSGFASVADGISDVQVVPVAGTNDYKLQYKKFGDADYSDAGTFSRATTLTGAWSSGTLTVTASPQGETHTNEPTISLASAGSGAFTANIMDYTDDDRTAHPNKTSQKSITAYLHQDGSNVGVYTSKSGSTYSGLVVSIQVSGGGSVCDLSNFAKVINQDGSTPRPSGTYLQTISTYISELRNQPYGGYITFIGNPGNKTYVISVG